MSSSLRRRGTKAVLAGTAALTALAFAPGVADAEFTFTRCQGSDVQGRGASFQTNAQAGFTELFGGSNGCSGSPAIGAYDGAGSGAGRRAFGERSGTNTTGARDVNIRYVAADEAPNAAQRAQIQSGPIDGGGNDVTASDDGLVRVLPVAVGATVIAVNYPDNCTLPAASATNANGPNTATVQDARLRITSADVEKVFGAEITTWGALVPGIEGFNGKATGDCLAQPIRRVVRAGDSGTTFSVKQFLNTINGARGWATAPLGATPNTMWPRVGGSPTAPVVAATCTTDLCANSGSDSGGNLLTLLGSTDGAFGYADIRTARQRGFEVVNSTADTTYWLPIENTNVAGPSNYFEPTADANGFKTGGNPGANCANTSFSNVPADTLGDFSQVTGANTPTGYSICVPTYMLAWDDYAKVYGTDDTEQRKARTVKDYIDLILGDVAQAGLAARDYQALPASLRALAVGGAAEVNFNKGGGGGTPPPPPAPTPTPTPTPSATPAPTPPPAPNNAFTIDSARVSKSKVISLTLQLPGSGAISASAIAKGKGFRIGSATGTAAASGTQSVQIKPSKATIKALKKLPKNKKLTAAITVTFTPTGGTASTQTRNVSLKGTKKKKKKRN